MAVGEPDAERRRRSGDDFGERQGKRGGEGGGGRGDVRRGGGGRSSGSGGSGRGGGAEREFDVKVALDKLQVRRDRAQELERGPVRDVAQTERLPDLAGCQELAELRDGTPSATTKSLGTRRGDDEGLSSQREKRGKGGRRAIYLGGNILEENGGGLI